MTPLNKIPGATIDENAHLPFKLYLLLHLPTKSHVILLHLPP